MNHATYDVWAVFWIGPTLLLLTIPLASKASRVEGDPHVGRFILGAALLKVVGGTLLRYGILYEAYEGTGDAIRYHRVGQELAPVLRSGIYESLGKISGTRFMEVFTGQIYALTGATELGGFMIYSWLAFCGMYMMYRAFQMAVPAGNLRRYRLMLFLFPTMVFWTSSIGKEAFITFCLGLVAHGFATVLQGRIRGLFTCGLGLWATMVVRPHIALMLVVAAGLALVVQAVRQRQPTGPDRRSIMVLAVCLIVGAIFAVSAFEDRFGLDELNIESAESVLDETEERSAQGGSEFDSPTASNPAGFLIAAVTVLLRPLPFEVTNLQGLVSSMEGVCLAAAFVFSISQLKRLPRMALKNAYVGASVLFTALFIYGFASVENFGILVRQRAQVLPFVFVLLCSTRPSAVESGVEGPPNADGSSPHGPERGLSSPSRRSEASALTDAT